MSDKPVTAPKNGKGKPHLVRFEALLDEINRESERGRVLICAAMLDDQLAECISARLLNHSAVEKLVSGFNAPLGNFSSRILAALALGIVSTDEYNDLEIVRGIRNDFAHRMGIGFGDPSIKDRCANLRFAAKDYSAIVVGASGQFTTAAVALVLRLTNRAHYVSKKRLIEEAWPY